MQKNSKSVSNEKMRLSRIMTHDFLHTYDYVIDLNLDARITILHGPNGCGKTNLLKFLDSLFNKKFWQLRDIPFKVVRLFFDSGEELRVYSTFFQLAREYLNDQFYEKFLLQGDLDDSISLYFEILSQEDQNWRKIYSLRESGFMEIIPSTEQNFNHMDQIKHRINNYIIEYPDDSKNLKVIMDRVTFLTKARGQSIDQKKKREIGEIPSILRDICAANRVLFIQTQRLFTFDKKQNNLPINELVKCSEELKKSIAKGQKIIVQKNLDFSKKLNLYLKNKDHSEKSSKVPTIDELDTQLFDLSKWFWERLYWDAPVVMKSDESFPYFEIDSDNFFGIKILADKDNFQYRIILGLFVQHLDDIINSLNEYDSKIHLFKDLLEEFSLKEFAIMQKGLQVIYDSRTQTELQPVKLSSGEQHLFIIFFSLLLRTRGKRLILIDEPELSLHIHWQRKFLKILQKILVINPVDIVLATHSPDIVFDRRDLAISMRGNE